MGRIEMTQMYSGANGLAGVSMLTVGHFAFLDHNTYFNVNLTSDELEGGSSTISSIQTNALGFAGFINEVPDLSILGADSIIGKYIRLQNLEG